MTASRGRAIMLIDVVGVVVVAGSALAFAWLTVLRDDGPRAAIRQLDAEVTRGRREAAALQAALDRQTRVVASRRSQLDETGRLPERTPIERDLNTLSALASAHGLHVVRVTPLAPREYAGLLELRYSFEVQGSGLDVIRFFRAVEDARIWADIGFLKVERPVGGLGEAARPATAVLTFSLFSSNAETEAGSGAVP